MLLDDGLQVEQGLVDAAQFFHVQVAVVDAGRHSLVAGHEPREGVHGLQQVAVVQVGVAEGGGAGTVEQLAVERRQAECLRELLVAQRVE